MSRLHPFGCGCDGVGGVLFCETAGVVRLGGRGRVPVARDTLCPPAPSPSDRGVSHNFSPGFLSLRLIEHHGEWQSLAGEGLLQVLEHGDPGLLDLF